MHRLVLKMHIGGGEIQHLHVFSLILAIPSSTYGLTENTHILIIKIG